MSDYEALMRFNRTSIDKDMIQYLSLLTESIINVKSSNSMCSIALPPPPLTKFIKTLCLKSNIQTPTLMASTVFLEKLKKIIPSNVYGIESTRHRIFLGCLILSAKTLNDSSPLNKHWAKYTDGFIHLREVNTIERELLEYFDWDVKISTDDLFISLSHFLEPIKQEMITKERQHSLLMGIQATNTLQKFNSIYDDHTNVSIEEVQSSLSTHYPSSLSLPSLASSQSSSSYKNRSPLSNSSISEEDELCNNIKVIDELHTKQINDATKNKKITIKRSAAWHSFF